MRIVILRSAVEDLARGRDFYERQGDGLGDYFEESLTSEGWRVTTPRLRSWDAGAAAAVEEAEEKSFHHEAHEGHEAHEEGGVRCWVVIPLKNPLFSKIAMG